MTQRILITGAAGRIGGMLRPRLARPGRELRLMDIVPVTAGANEEAITGTVTDLDAVTRACDGVDAVVHLAGHPGEVGWAGILSENINGTYVALEAARRAGVPRVVFASSNHAVGYHPATDAPDYAYPRPDTLYGVGKVAGEALGSLYHDRYGLDVICLRIGTCAEKPMNERALATWLSPDDVARLVEASVTAPSPGFRIVWGISANTRAHWSLDEARALGYEPADDAEVFAGTVGPPSPLELKYLGGDFAADPPAP